MQIPAGILNAFRFQNHRFGDGVVADGLTRPVTIAVGQE
jgi:hypothetical protein